ncbi:MAG: hypothetical protein ACKODX_20000 [Gemmata sp.]
MSRCVRVLVLLAGSVAVAGCDSKPAGPATDPDSVEKFKQLQQRASQGEGGSKDKPK